MLDAHSVITQATHGIVKELAAEMEVSLPRCYELLGDQCVYPKAKRLIRKIAALNPSGARLIKADMDALWLDILCDDAEVTAADLHKEVTAADLHKEAFEAVQACLENKCDADRRQELRELIAVAEQMLEGIGKKTKQLRLAR